jgi:hypothetical protein
MDRNVVGSIYGSFSFRFDPLTNMAVIGNCFRPIRNKNCLWWPCLLMDRDKMSNLYRRPSIDDTYQVSIYLAKRFQRRRFFRNQPIRNKNCLWQPCLLMDRDKMKFLIPFWSVNKHGRHRQLLFLIGRFLKQLFLGNRLAKWYEAW